MKKIFLLPLLALTQTYQISNGNIITECTGISVSGLNGKSVFVNLFAPFKNIVEYEIDIYISSEKTKGNYYLVKSDSGSHNRNIGLINSYFIENSNLDNNCIISIDWRFRKYPSYYFDDLQTYDFELKRINEKVVLPQNEGDGSMFIANEFNYDQQNNYIYEFDNVVSYKGFYSFLDSRNNREINISSLEFYPPKEVESIFLIIKDKNKIFNEELKDPETGFIIFPLALIDNHYYLKDDFKLFVNPFTRDLSFEEKSGYNQTSHLFLPINSCYKTNELECQILNKNVDGLGDDFQYDFIYIIKEEYFGSCYDSSYCIEINPDHEQNDLEKVYEVNYD